MWYQSDLWYIISHNYFLSFLLVLTQDSHIGWVFVYPDVFSLVFSCKAQIKQPSVISNFFTFNYFSCFVNKKNSLDMYTSNSCFSYVCNTLSELLFRFTRTWSLDLFIINPFTLLQIQTSLPKLTNIIKVISEHFCVQNTVHCDHIPFMFIIFMFALFEWKQWRINNQRHVDMEETAAPHNTIPSCKYLYQFPLKLMVVLGHWKRGAVPSTGYKLYFQF